ncbi:amino acid adenylation domain-containing protein [Saccharothrix sp. BKS2]|uniref:non-ribosomal peptide synthetase n=1 Tax=Saccharothrix sp. BKS2 TaxID=3064400 RepID=UPI0039EAB442
MTEQDTAPHRGAPAGGSLESRLAGLTPAQRALLERLLAGSGVEVGLRRRPAGVEIPASYEQERLYFMSQLVAHPEIFYVPTALWLRGNLDVEALRRAVTRLVERHEALRTVFRDAGSGPRQVVLDRLDVPLGVEDCAGAADPCAEARRRASASVLEPFDLADGPLLRCRLYRTAADEHLFAFTEHHIVSDHWSLDIVLSDLGALYGEEIGAGPGPRPLDLHYPDFAYWQRNAVDEQVFGRQLAYWRDRLADLPAELDLPTDRPRPAVRGSQGRFHPIEFDADLVAPLRDLARSQSTTLLGAFLASYVGFLSRLVREDIVVGVPVAGRPRPETQRMVGYFLNWLPIRVDVADRPSLRELVRRTGAALAGAMANQDLQFNVLVQELQPARRPGVTPVFQTSLSLRDGAPQPPYLPGVDVAFAELDGSATHFDLMVELWQEGDRVRGFLPYDEELFDESTVAAYARWFRRLVAAGTAAPDQPVATLPVFDEDEQALLHGAAVADGVAVADGAAAGPSVAVASAATYPVEGPSTAAPSTAAPSTAAPSTAAPSTLPARFAAVAAARPDAPAVADDRTRLTYAQLDRRSDRIAHVLLDRGVRPGDVVGLVLDRTVDLVAAVLGVLKCGAAYLPVDPDGPPERAAAQFADCGVATVLTSPGHAGHLPTGAPAPAVLRWDDGEFAAAPDTPVAVEVPAGAPAYVIYTSGSTGAPKGVLVTHANVLRLFEACLRRFDVGPDDTWTLFHSCAFDFSVWELWGALLHGGRLVVVPQRTTRAPDAFADLLAAEGVTVLSQTPSAFAQLARQLVARRPPGLRLRYVVFGGEALDHAALGGWFDAFGDEHPRLVNMYGITETTVHVTHRRVTRGDVGRGGSLIGPPLDDLSAYLLDDDLRPVPVGVPGELFVGGAGVALGYQGDPALTARRMLPDPFSPVPGRRMYRSGDIAVLRRDGELSYLGRRDEQHKIRGHRIELAEVRAALDRLPGVARAAVVVVEDRVGAATLVGYVVPEPGHAPDGAEVRGALLRGLPDWMVPSSVEVVPELPLTRNGKLDRAALAAHRAGREGARRPTGPAPEGSAAATLGGIWSELLGVTDIGAEDHFFELGGHSLMVVQLVSRIHAAFGVDLPMVLLFERPRLQAMADAVEELAASGTTAAPAPTPAPTPSTGRSSPAPGAELPDDAPQAAVRAQVVERLAGLDRPASPRPATPPEVVLLTGATGFVGAFALVELLHRGLDVVCLARGGTARRPELLAHAERLGLGDAVARGFAAGRVELVDGDLGAPRLGLADPVHRDLAERVGAVLHSAAWVNHVYPYAQLAPANAHSAAALLEFAAAGRRKNVVHVSTSAVVDSAAYPPGEVVDPAPLRALPTGPAGYVRSKAVAEEYLRHAAGFDVPAVVVRVPAIFGDRVRFQVNEADAVWSWCRAVVATGGYPGSFDTPGNELFQALPADAAAVLLVDQLLTADQPGCRYVNAVPDAVCGTADLVTAVRACGHPLRPVPDARWYEEVSRLDAGEIWVAGTAAGIARLAAGAPAGTAPRRLHRFAPGGGPEVRRLLAEHAVRTTEELAGYIKTLVGTAGDGSPAPDRAPTTREHDGEEPG